MFKGVHVVIFVTCSSREEAEKIAMKLLEQKLVACINIVHPVKSMFWWEGKIDVCEEALMIIKSKIDKSREIIETIRKHHSYSIPEIIMLPVLMGYSEYLEWIDKVVK